MNKQIRFAIAFNVLFLSLVFAGCSKDDPDKSVGKRISKITQIADARRIVKDAQSGAVISDDTIHSVLKERVFTWNGDILEKYSCSFNGELVYSVNYIYSDGKLVKMVDYTDNSECVFYYSNHLDSILSISPGRKQLMVLRYDENERVKSLEYLNSDGSNLIEGQQYAKLRKEYSFKGNNVSSYSILEYHYVDDIEPGYTKTMELEYSAAINPLKGLFTEALWDYNYEYEFLSDNICSYYRIFDDEMLLEEQKAEVKYDNDNYPVELKFVVDDDYYSGGKEKINQGYIIESYEYLDK